MQECTISSAKKMRKNPAQTKISGIGKLLSGDGFVFSFYKKEERKREQDKEIVKVK